MSRIRITGGEWRSRLVQVADAPGLRPTPDRVRETLFNWLGQDLDGLSCLDLFAGSGILGFEAASRGADHVALVEHSRPAFAALEKHAEAFDVRDYECDLQGIVNNANYQHYLEHARHLCKWAPGLMSLLAPQVIFVCESNEQPPSPSSAVRFGR